MPTVRDHDEKALQIDKPLCLILSHIMECLQLPECVRVCASEQAKAHSKPLSEFLISSLVEEVVYNANTGKIIITLKENICCSGTCYPNPMQADSSIFQGTDSYSNPDDKNRTCRVWDSVSTVQSMKRPSNNYLLEIDQSENSCARSSNLQSRKITGVSVSAKLWERNNSPEGLDTSNYAFTSRYFSPWNGIPEDPVNGSSHTLLGPYWATKLHCSSLANNSNRTVSLDALDNEPGKAHNIGRIAVSAISNINDKMTLGGPKNQDKDRESEHSPVRKGIKYTLCGWQSSQEGGELHLDVYLARTVADTQNRLLDSFDYGHPSNRVMIGGKAQNIESGTIPIPLT